MKHMLSSINEKNEIKAKYFSLALDKPKRLVYIVSMMKSEEDREMTYDEMIKRMIKKVDEKEQGDMNE
jgi:hypothetical protein